MADAQYRSYNFLFESKGVVARPVDDTVPQGAYLALTNCEELAENALGSRLGSVLINKTGSTVNALVGGAVHTVNKLAGLNGSAWRYAGCGANLYRRTGLSAGPYAVVSNTMSGQPWSGVVFRPEISSYPYLFIADAAGMLKDNGSLAFPLQQMGIFQPQYPVQAQAQPPDLITLDNYTGMSGDYTYGGIGGGTIGTYVSTTLVTANGAPGIFEVEVADPTEPGLFQLLTIGSGAGQETVLVLELTANGFIANFTKAHTIGDAVTNADLLVTVPASTTATVSKSFGGTPIAAWPVVLQQADYIGLYLYVSDPSQIRSITLKFDCGDGSFNTDYFYKVIGQGPLQSLLEGVNDPTTAATDAILSNSLGLYGNSSSSIAQLNGGLTQWTPLLIQLSDFAGSGRAAFDDPVHNWAAVNGYEIEIVTNDVSSADVAMSSLILFGGAGPDSFAGVAYDWLFTFYNSNDGTESNPCMVMTNINPPLNTNWITPRRQPVLLTLTYKSTVDPQVTHARIYRRGGTLGDNYRRVDTIPITDTPQQYTDTSSDSDIENSDFISFVNDVPVTSTLPVPVNTTLAFAITTTNQEVEVRPVSMDNISVGQQVIIGDEANSDLINNVEIVVVLTVLSDRFTAFVQNTHAVGELVSATAKYGQPVTIMAQAYGQMWFAGDPNNPHYLYWSAPSNPQAVSSAAFVEVGTPDDPITVIVQFKGNLYVSTRKFWWSVAPGSNQGSSPTVYPTAAKHGCVAPFGWLATEEAIFYQAIDGIRAFAGGASTYLTQDQEFIFQDIGTTPIVQADPNNLSKTVAAYWNNMLFFSYVGMDAARHRLILHTVYKRWRNDDLDVTSILLEADTNTLVVGSSNGLVRIDRRGVVDEGNVGGVVTNTAIAMDLILPQQNQGMPVVQKQYQEFTLDCDTGGMDVEVTLIFNDGEFTAVVGTINTSDRQRVNLNLNAGQGYTAYKVGLQLTCAATARAYIFQATIRALALAMTRQSSDTYNLKFSTDEAKLCKQIYVEYTSNSEVDFNVTYDDPAWPPFAFTLPTSAGVRKVTRVRLPAVKLKYLRAISTSDDVDYQLWDDSAFDVKPLCQGKGYEKFKLLSMEA